MNNEYDDIERMLKERLVPMPVPRRTTERMRRIWRTPEVDRDAAKERRMRLQLHVWQWAFATAAAVAVVIAIAPRLQTPPTPAAVPAGQPAIASANTQAQPLIATNEIVPQAPLQNVSAMPSDDPVETHQRILSAEDLGLVGYGANDSARQVRVRYLETQRWRDPSGGLRESSAPREAILQLPVGRVHDNGTGAVQEGPIHIIRKNPDTTP